MTRNEFYYRSADKKTKIHAVAWCPEEEPKAILQIAHGVTEHILCYEEMAEYFTKRGMMLVGNDHLGHGTSIAEGAKAMYFGPQGSWDWVVQDIYTCMKKTKEKYPGVPYYMLGLSLGSFAVRTLLIQHPGEVDGVVLVGTGQSKAMPLRLARCMAKMECARAGDDQSTPMIQKMAFGIYNKQFQPNRTEFDWLCAGRQGLDAYMADPLRGEAISAGVFREMLNGMLFTMNMKNQKEMDATKPVLILSGEKDPVGNTGRGIKAVVDSFRRAGVQDVKFKLYPGLRHNLFIEDEKQQIFQDIFRWIQKRNKKNRQAA